MSRFEFNSNLHESLSTSYFNAPGIPQPMVLKSWLSKLEVEAEDDTNLALVAQRIREKNETASRRRGRPRKDRTENVSVPTIIAPEWPLEDNLVDLVQIDVRNENISDSESKVIQQKEISEEETFTKEAIVEFENKSGYSCLMCNKSFKCQSTLKYHSRIHSGELLTCDKCGKGFVTKYLLKCHQRIHTGELFSCKDCNKGFITAELLKVHRRRHTGERPFACDQCTKRFPSSSNLMQHKETHLLEKKYLCTECGAAFNQKRCLECHMLIHGEKTHSCSVCGKQWARKSDLVEHMRVHTRDKPFRCEVCDSRFTQASSLKRHILTHQEIKSRVCSICDRVLKSEFCFQRHMQCHTKETTQVF